MSFAYAEMADRHAAECLRSPKRPGFANFPLYSAGKHGKLSCGRLAREG